MSGKQSYLAAKKDDLHASPWHDANKTMKNKGEIKMFEKMKELIAEQLNCPAEEIKMESSFKEDLGADSLDLFELVMSLEDTYGVEIPSEELEQLTTVESVVDYLETEGRRSVSINSRKSIKACFGIRNNRWRSIT